MGVRLVNHNFQTKQSGGQGAGGGTMYHDELLHRDAVDQHPIYAITGLQEVLNTIEANLLQAFDTIQTKENELKQYTNDQISDYSITVNNQFDTVNNRIDNLNILDGFQDTNTIDLNYNENNKTLKADVKVYHDVNQTNALLITDDGFYVPKFVSKDSDTITWSSKSQGETPYELFTEGLRFSHNKTNSNVYDPFETDSWQWDNSYNTFIQTIDSNTYNGIVSKDYYDNYEHTVQVVSNDNDDDINAIVIGFVFDENDHPHTLSAILNRGADYISSSRFAIYYNYNLPGQTIVANYAMPNGFGEWSGNSISLYITKNRNIITISATQWNYLSAVTSIEDARRLPFIKTFNIDLDDYSWGYHFRDKVKYGYGNHSQKDSLFNNIFFYSNDKRSSEYFVAHTKVSDETDNAIEIKEDGLFVEKFVISEDINNGLEKRENGYFVQRDPMRVSDQRLNGIETLEDGSYYVKQSNSYITVEQEIHNFVLGDFIYFDNRTNLYKKAIAKDDFDINIIGMVSYVYDNNKFEYVCSGFFKTELFNSENGYVQGMPVYISDTEAGKVTQKQPDISKAVGYPVDNLGIIISIERGIQYNGETQIGDFKTSANNYNIRSDGFVRITEDFEYKYSLMENLINTLTEDFKDKYLKIDIPNNSVRFINVEDLRRVHNIEGFTEINLFIRAF